MSASIIEQILAHAAAALDGTTAAGANVFRGRVDALAAEDIPGINIRRVPHGEEALAQTAQRLVVEFDVECFVDDSADWETAADALHMQAHAVLAADAQIAALGKGLRCTGTDPQGDSADRVIGKLTAHYRIQALVRPGDLTRPFN